MDAEIKNGPIGNVGRYDVAFQSGKLVVSASADVPPGELVNVSIVVDSDKVLDAIAAAIPGKVDDALISVIKLALKA